MPGCSICLSSCLPASKWKHLPCTANICPLPGVEAGLLAWPETQSLVYFLAPAAVIKRRAAWQTPQDTLSHMKCVSYYPFLCFLTPLFAPPASLSLFLKWERQPAPNYIFLTSPSFAISRPEFVISDTASQVISALRAIMGMVTRHTGPVRSCFPECPQCSTPVICVVPLLLMHVPLNHLRGPSSPHSTVCSFCQLLTIFPVTSSFPHITSTLMSFSSCTLSR